MKQAIWKKGAAVCPTCEFPVDVSEKTVAWKNFYGEWHDGMFYMTDVEHEPDDESGMFMFCAVGHGELQPPDHWDGIVYPDIEEVS